MTTAVGAALSDELSRAEAWGPHRIEFQTIAIVSGDTGATVTAKQLDRVDFCFIGGDIPVLTAQPTYSGNVVTLAWTDPVASKFAQVLLIGK